MNQDDNGLMSSVDIDRLLFLIQNNPAIFNPLLKEHHNNDIISKIWNEIGEELDVPGHICKVKWCNLRNSYVRYLRQLKMPRGSAKKKKKWHLADAMEFLMPYVGPCRNMSINLEKDHLETASLTPQRISDQLHEVLDIINDASEEADNFSPKKKQRKTTLELEVPPMTEFFKTTNKRNVENKEESEFLSYFKSLIPDAILLSAKRKRQFKSSVMTTLHQLLDEQEAEQEYNKSSVSS